MINEFIEEIYQPKDDSSWAVVKTNVAYYTLRLGGFKQEESFDKVVLDKSYEKVTAFSINPQIKKIFTDGEWLYMILDNHKVLVGGWIDITIQDELVLGVKIVDYSEYEDDFFDADYINSLKLGTDGWSEKILKS